MANFPLYQYQPQVGGFGQMQPMYQGYQAVQQPQTQEQSLFCRMATNSQEVQAYPVDFSGRPMTFLGPGLQTIWVKSFDANTGGSIVTEYRRAPSVIEEQPKIAAPSIEEFQKLQQTVMALQDEVLKLRTARRRASREETEDEV